MFNIQIVEELLATAPSVSSQTVESEACTSDVDVMEQEGVIETRLESSSEQSRRHACVQARPQTKSKGKALFLTGLLHVIPSSVLIFDYTLGVLVDFRPNVKDAGIQCNLPIRMVSSTPLRTV